MRQPNAGGRAPGSWCAYRALSTSLFLVPIVHVAFAGCGGDDGDFGDSPGGSSGSGSGSSSGSGGAAFCFTEVDCSFGFFCNAGRCEPIPEPSPSPTPELSPTPSVTPLPSLPAEVEDSLELGRPITGQTFVYVVNPRRGTVARIDPQTRAVDTLEVGDSPDAAVIRRDEDVLVVLNRGSRDLSILRADQSPAPQRRIPLDEGYDRLALSPSGRYALCWYTPERATAVGRSRIAIIDVEAALTADRSDRAALRAARQDRGVALRIGRVAFAERGERALLVSRNRIHVIDFDQLLQTPLLPSIAIESELAQDISSRQTLVTPELGWLFIQHPRSSFIEAFDIEGRAHHRVPLPDAPTDIEVSADGTQLVAVVRRRPDANPTPPPSSTPSPSPSPSPSPDAPELGGAVHVIPIPGGVRDHAQIRHIDTGDVVIGQLSLAPAGAEENRDLAVLFTTAVHREELTFLDLSSGELTHYPALLGQAVGSVRFAPDGRTLFVNHRPSVNPRETDETEAQVDRSYGFSVVSIAAEVATPQVLPRALRSVSFEGRGDFASALLPGESASAGGEIHVIDLRSLLFVDTISLASPPLFSGFLPRARTAFVAQDHPAGRMTFVDLDNLEIRTLTGYEINSEIRR